MKILSLIHFIHIIMYIYSRSSRYGTWIHVCNIFRKMIHNDKSGFARLNNSIHEAEPINNQPWAKSIPVAEKLFFNVLFVILRAAELSLRFNPIHHKTIHSYWKLQFAVRRLIVSFCSKMVFIEVRNITFDQIICKFDFVHLTGRPSFQDTRTQCLIFQY